MAKIELAKQTVEAKTPVPQIPEFNTASTSAEFNSELNKRYEAIKQRGDATTKLEFQIANRLQEHFKMQDEKRASEIESFYRQESVQMLENPKNDKKGKPIGLLKREMNQAKGITDEYWLKHEEMLGRYLEQAENGDQRAMLERSLRNHFDANYDRIYKHEANEFNRAYTETVNNNLKGRILDSAAIRNPDALDRYMTDAGNLSEARDNRQGLPTSAMKQNKLHVKSEIAKNAISSVMEENLDEAQRMYDKVKYQLDPTSRNEIEDIFYGKGLQQKSYKTFLALRDKRLPDLSYNYRAAQDAIMNDSSIPDGEKRSIWEGVKSLMNEDEQITNKTKEALHNEFISNVYKAKDDGVPLSEALKLSASTDDPRERAEREDVIKKAYNRTVESDPDMRMKLWMGIENGTVTQDQLDQARRKGLISLNDWDSLKKKWYQFKIKGRSVEDKAVIEYIKEIGKGIKSKEQRRLYEWEAIKETRGKPLIEAKRIARELQENDPESGYFSFTQKKRYQTAAKRREEDLKQMDKLDLELGKDVVDAIGEGLLDTQSDFGSKDIYKFIDHYNGIHNLREGTKLNSLIKAMKKNKKKITTQNLDAAINKNLKFFTEEK